MKTCLIFALLVVTGELGQGKVLEFVTKYVSDAELGRMMAL